MNDDHEIARPKELGVVQHTIGHIIIAVILIFIFGLAVMWLWNGLLPRLFGVKLIGYWQGLGLVILARLLFGSFGFGFGHHRLSHHFPRHRRIAHGNWADYNDWWQADGQQAFDAFLARKSQQTGEQHGPKAE